MDAMQFLLIHDVADKVGNPGIIGAIAAGLATFALLAGVRRIIRKNLSLSFPPDAEAAQSKYDLAFKQLQKALSENPPPEKFERLLDSQKDSVANVLALKAFEKACREKGVKKP